MGSMQVFLLITREERDSASEIVSYFHVAVGWEKAK